MTRDDATRLARALNLLAGIAEADLPQCLPGVKLVALYLAHIVNEEGKMGAKPFLKIALGEEDPEPEPEGKLRPYRFRGHSH